ncbi:MAG: peptidase S41, partial [Paludibacter sp.]|nr:peptidase S41 [Paludibacter sp.]
MKKNISFQRFFITVLVFSMMSVSLWAAPKDNRTFRISKNLSVFNTVFRELEAYYVDTLNYDKMMKTAIDEMLSKLDPYTVYMPEEETSDLTFMT